MQTVNWTLVLLFFGLVIFSGCTQEARGDPGCSWVYKTTDDYFDYLAGTVNDRTGEMKIRGFGLNRSEHQLDKGYILNGLGCISSYPSDWVIFNIKKTEFGNSIPSLDDVIDWDPFEEFYVCPVGVDYSVEELNEIINSGQLSEKCKRLKK